MTTQEIAKRLVELCAKAQFDQAMTELYADEIVSVEAGAPPGGSRETKGIEGVRAKGEWWTANHEVHSAEVEGPLVAGPFFTVAFRFDVTFKPKNQRFRMDEVAIYKVENGKIVYEEFFYTM